MSPDVRPPANPVITVTDAQLRKAFGPSPIFGGTPGAEAGPPTAPAAPAPPLAKREPSSSETDDELEAMKQLSVQQLLTVFKG